MLLQRRRRPSWARLYWAVGQPVQESEEEAGVEGYCLELRSSDVSGTVLSNALTIIRVGLEFDEQHGRWGKA